jgi:hypothetical protein
MTLDTPWCPCQEEMFEALYPDLPKEDMPYVDEMIYLAEVHTRHYYERKREQNRDPQSISRVPPGPSTPRTRRGTKIIDANFPEADYVCPTCEQGYVEECTVRKVEA